MTTTDPKDAARLRRAHFRAWRRGFREMDLIMGHFADQHLADLAPAQLARFEALLDVPDQDLYAWILGRDAPAPEHDHDVLDLLRSFRFFARTLWAATGSPAAAT